nr:hypothetical protein [Desulfovibrio sp.]
LRCVSQVLTAAGPLRLSGYSDKKDQVSLLRFVDGYEQGYAYHAEVLSQLPSDVGIVQGESIRTQGKPGFLLAGPNVSLRAGKYRLTITGSCRQVSEARVEILSRDREFHYLNAPLRPLPGDFQFSEELTLPEDVINCELRVFVGAKDEISLSGCSLLPISAH